jgi:hypothetical protein
MPRSRWFLAAAALATAAIGCAHCDTCDDFPTPCSAEVGCGDEAGPMPMPMLAPTMASPVMMGGPALMGAPAPIVTSQPVASPPPASGTGTGTGTSGTGAGSLVPPPLPNGGGSQPFSPQSRR